MQQESTSFKPNCTPIAIGSLPHSDPGQAFDLVRRYSPECLFWPQLPARDFRENMMVQFTEEMPGLKIDEENERIYFEKGNDILELLTNSLEKIITDDFDYFKISESYASGFYAMERAIKNGLSFSPEVIKGQVTGPITFGLTATDSAKKPIIYDPEMAEVIVKCLGMKARWQSMKFKALLPEAVRVVFFDEPYLTQIGSAYIGIQPEEAITYLNDCFEAVEGMTGIHVCGKTDWSLVMQSNVDIIHFDAFDYAEAMALYPDNLNEFLSEGGFLAWGVVPTDKNVSSVQEVGLESIAEKMEASLDVLDSLGIDRFTVLQRSFVSPSCGLGSMSVRDSERAFELTSELSANLREKHSLAETPGLKSS